MWKLSYTARLFQVSVAFYKDNRNSNGHKLCTRERRIKMSAVWFREQATHGRRRAALLTVSHFFCGFPFLFRETTDAYVQVVSKKNEWDLRVTAREIGRRQPLPAAVSCRTNAVELELNASSMSSFIINSPSWTRGLHNSTLVDDRDERTNDLLS